MNSLQARIRQAKRAFRYLKGYFDLDTKSHEISRLTDFSQCPRPVLLLYGFMSTRRVFEVLERRLRRDGYGVFTINLGGFKDVFNTEGIDTLATKVARKVERMYERFPTMGPLSIIGHSKGGLIGADYLKRGGGRHRLQSLITLGTPFNGSRSAYFGIVSHGLVSRSIWQLTPLSPYLKKLAQTPFPDNVSVRSIYSEADRVNGVRACQLETSAENPWVKNIQVRGVAHREFVFKDNVYQVIKRELRLAYELTAPGHASIGETSAP
jgi:triacylglycerol lipase